MSDADKAAKVARDIDEFCQANFRSSYECRPRGQIFPPAALEIATMSSGWPRLHNSIISLIGTRDFFEARISTTTAIAERDLHQALITALQEVAVSEKPLVSLHQVVDEVSLMEWRAAGTMPDSLRLAAWDALNFIKSSKPQN